MDEKDDATPPVEDTAPPEDNDAHKSDDLVAKANDVAERLERANRETARLQSQAQDAAVEKTLAGKAVVTEPTKTEEDPADYVKKVMANEIETKDT